MNDVVLPPAINVWLIVAAIFDATAAVAHLACIPGGGTWYRAMGAGERMVRDVERGRWAPHLLTTGIAGALAMSCGCALSGAGAIPRLPLLRPALVAISLVIFAARPLCRRCYGSCPSSRAFLINSSTLVLIIGATHAIGVATSWSSL